VHKVLFIGSDEEDNLMFCQALDQTGWYTKCTMAQTCAHAQLLVNNGLEPDYIFIDGFMTMVWNPDCLTGLINDTKLSEVKWVNYTAQKMPARPEHGEILRNFIVIPKPTSPEDVVEAVRTLFRRSIL
jgi:hypothetical protein